MNNIDSVNVSSPARVSGVRAMIFRVLTLVGLGFLVWTWFQPWWTAYIETLQQNGVVIYPYQMVIAGTLRDYPQWIMGAEMPVWFFPLMWVYLAVCVGLLIFSLFDGDEFTFSLGKLKMSTTQALIGAAGLAYVIFVVVFPIVISIRAPQFHGVQLQGNIFISMDEHTESYVVTSLQSGYWIACVTAVYLVVLAFLRNKIIGKS